MRHDIDILMRANNVDCLWISGAAQHNPSMVYLTGEAHITGGDLFFRPGETPLLCHGMMERDEAAKTGYKLLSYANYPPGEYLKMAKGDQLEASALRYKQILTDSGITSGRVMLYGVREFGPFYSLVTRLQELLPELSFSGDVSDSIVLEARATKSEDELENIRNMGRTTTRVVGNTRDLLASQRVKDGTLVKADGSPVTIGDVKSQINLWLAEYGAENPEGTIFAIGRDGGVPHSSGTASDPIQLGKAIVFDIFPCQAGGGYYYDLTRTWCLGWAPDEVQQAYEQVLTVYNQMAAELEYGVNPARYQARTCEMFEAWGHDTIRQNPRAEQGYIHSLGHGVGLDVHEKPWFGRETDPTNILQAGIVFTLEPGLYYPEKDFGVRLEDTWYVKPDRTFEKFVDFPMDLVIPMRGN